MKMRRDDDLEIPITPLIDIVFLLIVFFVVTSTIQNESIDRQVKLAKSYFVDSKQSAPPESITINVRHRGEGRRPRLSIAGYPVTLRQVETELRKVRIRFGNEVPVVLRASGELRYKYIDEVNESIGKAGLMRVRHSSRASVEGKD